MNEFSDLDFSAFPKELKLILLLIKMEGDKIPPNQMERFKDTDWALFLQLAKHHRVYPVLYLLLKKLGEPLIPQNVIESLQKEYCKNTFQMLYLSREMENISRLFAEGNIRALFLRGPVLAADLYGDVSLRTSVDLDIFVSVHDLEEVDKLLLNIGYFRQEYFSTLLDEWKWRHHHLNFIHPQSRVKLEIHWRLNEGPGKEPSFNELWDRKRVSSLTNHPIYFLEKEDLFLLLVTHGARHGWSRLGWLLDIHKLVKQKLNWEQLNRLLKRHQCLHIGGQALVLVSQLFHTPMTEEMKILTIGKRSRRLAQEALFYIRQIVNLHTNPVPEDIARYHKRHLFSLMSGRQKLLFVMSFFYPYPMDAEVLPLPRHLHFLYLPLRPILWAWRKARKHALS